MTTLYIFQKLSVQIEVQHRFHDAQMRGGTDRQELRHPFHDAEQNGDQVVIHAVWRAQ